MFRLDSTTIDKAIDKLLKDNPEMMGDFLNAAYRDLEGYEAAEEFHRKHMTPSLGTITVHDAEQVKKILYPILTKIDNKVVIEIGAGVGLLACATAKIAKLVYAIEVDPAWSWGFTKILYDIKPPNLTWIFGKAENMIGVLKGDIALIVTRSGHEQMKAIGKLLANEVIDVYEDYVK